MAEIISVEDKKRFLYWFITHHTLANRQTIWILNHIYEHPMMLEKVHFVEEAKYTPRGMVISTVDSEEVDFVFYKNQKEYFSIDVALHEVKYDWSNSLYIEINFPKSLYSLEYLRVLEDNPYIISDEDSNQEISEPLDIQQQLLQIQLKMSTLKDLINCSLEQNDRKDFLKYTEQFNRLEEQKSDLLRHR